MTDAERETVRMVYVGRRRGDKPAPGYGWTEESKPDDLHVFSKLTGTAVGGIYDVEIQRDETGRIKSAWLGPKYTGDRHPNATEVALWQAIDADTRREDSMRKAENRAAKAPELNNVLLPLRGVLAKAKSFDEVEAILTVMRNKLMREWSEGKLR